MSSGSAIHFEENQFCTSENSEIGGGGQAYSQHVLHMAAVLAGCRKALVFADWAVSLLFNTNGRRNHSFTFVRASFLAL